MSEMFHLSVDEDKVGIISFDIQGASVNTWITEAFHSFADVMAELENVGMLQGVVFISGKPETFIAGANLKQIEQMKTPEEARLLIDLFRNSFAKLNQLPYPSVAAIHGHCLGGGLEFALACTARIAKEGRNTLIGLPECNVGLFPAGGGTQRLPRLIGYPAIDLILKANLLTAKQAYEMGLVDRLLPAEGDLLNAARDFLIEMVEGKTQLKRPVFDFSDLDAIAGKAREAAVKAARGMELPAPMLALDSIIRGLKVSLEEGLEIEKENFVVVAMTNEAKGSINSFFLKGMTDKPKPMMSKGAVPKVVRKIGILGFGTMGRGVAIDLLLNTKILIVAKDTPDALERGKGFVYRTLSGIVAKNRMADTVETILERLVLVTDYGDAFGDADVVIEAVSEDLQVKKQVYKELSGILNKDCIIASNTSSIPVSNLAEHVDTPERFGGLHCFAPDGMMQLVEVIQGEKTSRETVDSLLSLCGEMKKRPIVCRDYPGFVVYSLLLPAILAAFRFVEEGNAIEKVDGAMVRFGLPAGPIRMTDEIGIDVIYAMCGARGIQQETLKNIVHAGRHGLKKSGKGLFLADGSVDAEALPFIVKRTQKEASEENIRKELLSGMVKAAWNILDHKVVVDHRMIDVGAIWGIGFPSYRGGLLRWSDLTGLSVELFGKNFY